MIIKKYDVEQHDGVPVLIKESAVRYDAESLENPDAIVKMLNNVFRLGHKSEERLFVVGFTQKMKPVGVFEVSHGTATESMCSPREIFIRLCLCGAVNFVLSHNHPSGDVSPSKADISATRRMCEVAKMIGIPLLDHIIISKSNYYSFAENNML